MSDTSSGQTDGTPLGTYLADGRRSTCEVDVSTHLDTVFADGVVVGPTSDAQCAERHASRYDDHARAVGVQYLTDGGDEAVQYAVIAPKRFDDLDRTAVSVFSPDRAYYGYDIPMRAFIRAWRESTDPNEVRVVDTEDVRTSGGSQ